MSFVVRLLNEKKEEYDFLLNSLNDQLERGDVFRRQWEVVNALQAKTHYETILQDIEEKMGLIS